MNCHFPFQPAQAADADGRQAVVSAFVRLSAMAAATGGYAVCIIDNLPGDDGPFAGTLAADMPRWLPWETGTPGQLSILAQALLIASEAFSVDRSGLHASIADPALTGLWMRDPTLGTGTAAFLAVPVPAAFGRKGGVLFHRESPPRTNPEEGIATLAPELVAEARRAMLVRFEHAAHAIGRPALARLSPREVQCIRLIAEGMTDDQVAHALHITRATVRYHLTNLCEKLGANSRSNAVYRAAAHGLLPPL